MGNYILFRDPQVYVEIDTGNPIHLIGIDKEMNEYILAESVKGLAPMDINDNYKFLAVSNDHVQLFLQDIFDNLLDLFSEPGEYWSFIDNYRTVIKDKKCSFISSTFLCDVFTSFGLRLKIREPLGKDILGETKTGIPVILTPIQFIYVSEDDSKHNMLIIDCITDEYTAIYDYPLIIYWEGGEFSELNDEIANILVDEFANLSSRIKKIIIPMISGISGLEPYSMIDKEYINNRVIDKFNY